MFAILAFSQHVFLTNSSNTVFFFSVKIKYLKTPGIFISQTISLLISGNIKMSKYFFPYLNYTFPTVGNGTPGSLHEETEKRKQNTSSIASSENYMDEKTW